MFELLRNEGVLWFLLLSVTILDILVPFALAPFYKGYSHTTMVMSSLGAKRSPVRYIYNVWLVFLGISLCFCSVGLFLQFSSGSFVISLCIALILFVFGMGAGILSGLFPLGDTKEMNTLSSKIHGYGASVGFSLLVFVPLLVAVLCLRNLHDSLGFWVSVLSFVVAIVSFTLFVMSDKDEFKNTVIAREGIWQRLSLIGMYLPLDYLALHYLLTM